MSPDLLVPNGRLRTIMALVALTFLLSVPSSFGGTAVQRTESRRYVGPESETVSCADRMLSSSPLEGGCFRLFPGDASVDITVKDELPSNMVPPAIYKFETGAPMPAETEFCSSAHALVPPGSQWLYVRSVASLDWVTSDGQPGVCSGPGPLTAPSTGLVTVTIRGTPAVPRDDDQVFVAGAPEPLAPYSTASEQEACFLWQVSGPPADPVGFGCFALFGGESNAVISVRSAEGWTLPYRADLYDGHGANAPLSASSCGGPLTLPIPTGYDQLVVTPEASGVTRGGVSCALSGEVGTIHVHFT